MTLYYPIVNGTPVVTVAASSSKTEVSNSVSQVKMSPVIQSSTSPSVQLPTSASISIQQKPVMRVTPLPDTQSGTGKPGTGVVSTAGKCSYFPYRFVNVETVDLSEIFSCIEQFNET